MKIAALLGLYVLLCIAVALFCKAGKEDPNKELEQWRRDNRS